MNKALQHLIQTLKSDVLTIPPERIRQLNHLANVLLSEHRQNHSVAVNFICTHNSRRSQLAEVWFRTLCNYYGVEGYSSYSGGTESTAFNPNMVAALTRIGFDVVRKDQSENPVYEVNSNDRPMYSKKYDDPFNPQSGYIAVMVCTDADEGCPIVSGASHRLSLPYDDPKAFDGTAEAVGAYDKAVRIVGRDMLYLVQFLMA